jgi:hypothetical protein
MIKRDLSGPVTDSNFSLIQKRGPRERSCHAGYTFSPWFTWSWVPAFSWHHCIGGVAAPHPNIDRRLLMYTKRDLTAECQACQTWRWSKELGGADFRPPTHGELNSGTRKCGDVKPNVKRGRVRAPAGARAHSVCLESHW